MIFREERKDRREPLFAIFLLFVVHLPDHEWRTEIAFRPAIAGIR